MIPSLLVHSDGWTDLLHVAVNTSNSPNAGLMLGQRRRRWPNIKPTLVQGLKCLQ